MGDVTEAIMEGELCQTCCVWIDDNIQGFPRYCNDCKPKPHKTISDAKRLSLRAKRKRKLKARREAKALKEKDKTK
jgi:hypothetical protein